MAEPMQLCNISENNFEQCTKCSICTTVCPVAAVTTDYPGPKQAGPDGERYRLKDPAYYDKMLKLCLNCKRCEVACPSNVHIADIIQRARMQASAGKHASLRDTMLASTDLLGTMATLVAPVTNATLGLKPVKLVMDSVMAIDKHRTFPAYSGTKFETWYKRHAASSQDAYPHHVSYFHGCYVNYNFPRLGQDLVKVMNAVGYGVHLLAKEQCCGVALIANGLYKQARRQRGAPHGADHKFELHLQPARRVPLHFGHRHQRRARRHHACYQISLQPCGRGEYQTHLQARL